MHFKFPFTSRAFITNYAIVIWKLNIWYYLRIVKSRKYSSMFTLAVIGVSPCSFECVIAYFPVVVYIFWIRLCGSWIFFLVISFHEFVYIIASCLFLICKCGCKMSNKSQSGLRAGFQ